MRKEVLSIMELEIKSSDQLRLLAETMDAGLALEGDIKMEIRPIHSTILKIMCDNCKNKVAKLSLMFNNGIVRCEYRICGDCLYQKIKFAYYELKRKKENAQR